MPQSGLHRGVPLLRGRKRDCAGLPATVRVGIAGGIRLRLLPCGSCGLGPRTARPERREKLLCAVAAQLRPGVKIAAALLLQPQGRLSDVLGHLGVLLRGDGGVVRGGGLGGSLGLLANVTRPADLYCLNFLTTVFTAGSRMLAQEDPAAAADIARAVRQIQAKIRGLQFKRKGHDWGKLA